MSPPTTTPTTTTVSSYDGSPFLRGILRVTPLLAGVAPLGFAIGAAGSASGLPPLTAWSSSVIVYGGSIQLVVMGLLESGAGPAVMVAAVLMASIPRSLFAVTLASTWGVTSWRWRTLAAYLLVEPVFAVTVTDRDTSRPRTSYLGAGICVLVTWLLATGTGAIVGGQLPTGIGLELIVPTMMLALAVGSHRTRSCWMTALIAGFTSLTLVGLPHRLGFIVGVVAGVAVTAVLTDRDPS